MNTRQIWVDHMIKIVHPVLFNLANNSLKKEMPIKKHEEAFWIESCTHLEAVGRTICGVSGWFNADILEDEEDKLRNYYLDLTIKGIANAVDINSPDFLYIEIDGKYSNQILVDTAFLAFGLIRAKEKLWDKLDKKTQMNISTYFKKTREIQPYFNNWLLFSGMIETFFLVTGEDCDLMRIDYCFKQMEQWYIGDGMYKDGEEYHNDYYNSYVIQPFLLEILKQVKSKYRDSNTYYPKLLSRAKRYAKIQEISINIDGTFMAIGRSLAYRGGAFHHLAYMSLNKQLPENISEGSSRCALTAVLEKCMLAPYTYDNNGWLNIGLYGQQKNIGENYISTGSLYLCTFIFLPLGLSSNDSFWQVADELYSMQQVWSGVDVLPDVALMERSPK